MGAIREISPDEIKSVYLVLKELRPHITEEQFVTIYNHARTADEFTFYAYFDNGQCLGLMGLRYLYDYVHQFHLYIDDLVVIPQQQSRGIGAKLLKFAENLAQEKKCTGLRLCTGVENERGKRFYERESWVSRAVVFKKRSGV